MQRSLIIQNIRKSITTQIKPRKERINLTIEQKLGYTRLIVHENHTKELCQLLKLPRSSYYYQIKDKSANNNTDAMIKFIKQTAIEVGHTYGKRRM